MSRSPDDKPYTLYTVGKGPPRRVLRVLLWAVLALVAVAALAVAGVFVWTAVALSGANDRVDPEARRELQQPVTTQVADTPSPQSPTVTVPPEPGAMNILVLGSDRRPDLGEKYGRSDTMMVVHVDPGTDFISVLSLPRDLQVDLGHHGTQKLNAAYAFGGDALAISTIRDLLGIRLDHYVNIDFAAFQEVTRQLGGIYVDVDRRYYYGGPDYEPIDIQPGYQRLAGSDALRYVRFRHDLDSDWGRIERQQRFLRTAKEQVLSWNMATELPGAVALLMRYVTTEIGAADAFRLAWYGAKLGFDRLKLVTLRGSDQWIDGVAYVVAGEGEVAAAVEDFLTVPGGQSQASATSRTERSATTTSIGLPATADSTAAAPATLSPSTDTGPIQLEGTRVEVRNAGALVGQATAAGAFLEEHGATLLGVGDAAGQELGASVVMYPSDNRFDYVSGAALIAQALGIHKMVEDNTRRHVAVLLGADFVLPAVTATQGSVETTQWRFLAGQTGFALMAPGWLPPDYTYAGSRVYDINAEAGPKRALKVMYRLGDRDQYLGLMETGWVDAPAASAGEQVTLAGATFTVVTVGSRVDRVWWKRDGVLYWLSNTLAFALDRKQMLQVAQSMVPVA